MAPSTTVKVMVVDDHPVVRSGLTRFLSTEEDIEVVAQCAEGIEAERMALKFRPEVVLLDVYMPGQSGLTTLRNLKERLPSTRVIMLTMSEQEEDLFTALQAGASGFVLKSEDGDTITKAIRRAIAGESTISQALTSKLVIGFRRSREELKLTNTEKKVLALLAEGLSNTEIAARMVISEGTVRTHISHMVEKVKVKDRNALMIYAVKHYQHASCEDCTA